MLKKVIAQINDNIGNDAAIQECILNKDNHHKSLKRYCIMTRKSGNNSDKEYYLGCYYRYVENNAKLMVKYLTKAAIKEQRNLYNECNYALYHLNDARIYDSQLCGGEIIDGVIRCDNMTCDDNAIMSNISTDDKIIDTTVSSLFIAGLLIALIPYIGYILILFRTYGHILYTLF